MKGNKEKDWNTEEMEGWFTKIQYSTTPTLQISVKVKEKGTKK